MDHLHLHYWMVHIFQGLMAKCMVSLATIWPNVTSKAFFMLRQSTLGQIKGLVELSQKTLGDKNKNNLSFITNHYCLLYIIPIGRLLNFYN